jgi:molybdate/tungstate transport system substrate-binding protein
MEHVRKLTELHRIPDLILLADDEVFPKFLAPNYTPWWADFAHNRMVVAYTDRSKAATEISDTNWYRILTRKGIDVGRADPDLAPVGYRTLTLFTLAALRYGDVGLARRLVENAPAKNVRPNAAELAALLAAGELDYIYDYESVARAQKFRYVVMPPEITGRPVTYALAIPKAAPHPAAAERLLEFLLSDSVKTRLRAKYVDMVDRPEVHGTGAPGFLAKVPCRERGPSRQRGRALDRGCQRRRRRRRRAVPAVHAPADLSARRLRRRGRHPATRRRP